MTERKFAPLVGPWTAQTNITAGGALYAVFWLKGLPSGLAGAARITGAHAALNHNAMQLGDPSVEWYSHFTRAEQSGMTPLPSCPGWFAQRFDQAYTECLGGMLYQNDLWFTVLKRPPAGIRSGLNYVFSGMRALIGGNGPLGNFKIPYAERVFLEEFEDLATRVAGALSQYGVRRLGLEMRGEGGWFSQIDEAYHIIMNNFHRAIPVSRGRCSYNITPYPMKFGEGAWEIHHGPGAKRFGTILSLKNYPVATSPKMFDPLRAAPFGLTMTNSFAFSRRSASLKALGTKFKHMVSSNDAATDDIRDVKAAENRLATGLNVWGSHHFSLAVHSRVNLVDLDRKTVHAETILSNAQLNVVRETKAIKPAFYAQIIGNRRWRTRPNPIPSEIFADFAAQHGVPSGRYEGRWGPPIVNLRTTADTEYPFHFQVQDAEQIPKEDLGSIIVIGPSGSGKTGLIGSLAMLSQQRQGARLVVVDKDCGLAPMINANDGAYLVLGNGVPSGLAPLRALTDSPADISYLTSFVRMLILADGRGSITSEEDDRLQRAVLCQMEMPPEMRELAGIAVALGQKDRGGARARLRKWCHGERLGWAVDCREDKLDITRSMMGYDTTALLKNEEVCSPILNYIFYRTEKLINGEPIVFLVDEMWHADKNEAFSADNNDKLTTIRKNEGVVALATQNAHTALTSANAHTFKQQIPTKIFFADNEASHEDLVTGFGLTPTEFHAVTVTLGRHQFLMKRPGGSVICRFDLSKRPDQIAVISGRRATYDLMNRLKVQYGPLPQDWLPHFERLAPTLVDKPLARKLEIVA